MRGIAARLPYCPWESLLGEVSPERRVRVSWSESNESATAAHALPEDRQAIERIGEFFAEHVG